MHLRELQIIDIVSHVVGNGSDKARLPCSKRVVKKGIKRESGEGRGVFEGNSRPSFAPPMASRIGLQCEISVEQIKLCCLACNEIKVSTEEFFVRLCRFEIKAVPLVHCIPMTTTASSICVGLMLASVSPV
ncbi:hypothetical protein SUGI_0687460 [Cryptomeria japonica]|nr:hypothetical protein SUGI_0687460 [Cryptomeria japonica]